MDMLRVGLKARLGIWIKQEVDNPKQSSWIIIQQYLATLLTFLHVKFVTTPGKKNVSHSQGIFNTMLQRTYFQPYKAGNP